MSDLGGMSGLFLGFSALSLFEFVEYFIDLGMIVFSGIFMQGSTAAVPPSLLRGHAGGHGGSLRGGHGGGGHKDHSSDSKDNQPFPSKPNPPAGQSHVYPDRYSPSSPRDTLTPTDIDFGSKTYQLDLLQHVK